MARITDSPKGGSWINSRSAGALLGVWPEVGQCARPPWITAKRSYRPAPVRTFGKPCLTRKLCRWHRWHLVARGLGNDKRGRKPTSLKKRALAPSTSRGLVEAQPLACARGYRLRVSGAYLPKDTPPMPTSFTLRTNLVDIPAARTYQAEVAIAEGRIAFDHAA